MSSKTSISVVELNRAIDFINKHREKFKSNLLITFENSSASGIGITTTVKLSEWVNSPILFEANITDYNDW